MTVGVEHRYRSQSLCFQSPQDPPPGAVTEARVNEDSLPVLTYYHANVDDITQVMDVVLDVFEFH